MQNLMVAAKEAGGNRKVEYDRLRPVYTTSIAKLSSFCASVSAVWMERVSLWHFMVAADEYVSAQLHNA